jgi:O-acetyl-ADP-ribose deacetylase (regulator of RNase III)
MTFRILHGDLFHSAAQTLSNPINCHGVMGGGLAMEFRLRFPIMFRDYVQRCHRGEVRVGMPYVWHNFSGGPSVLNFPTKDDWEDPSKLEYVEEGPRYLVEHYREMGIASLALPALGCGLGGLEWRDVQPMMEQELSRLDISVEIWSLKGLLEP